MESPRPNRSSLILAIESIATALGCLLLIVWMAKHVGFYATSSLWTDEITTIQAFTSHGLKGALTAYTSNNHLAFNALNAIFSGNDSFEPLRARIFSLAAVVIGATIGLTFFLRRGWRAEALIFALLAIGSSPFLILNLQARGYGFMFLAGVGTCVALLTFLENGRRRDLSWLALSVFLGSWAVPPFAFFGAPVLLAVFLLKRSVATFIAGVSVLVLLVLGYLPAISYYLDPNAVASMFGDHRPYDNWAAVGRTIHEYFTWNLPKWLAWIPLVIMLGLPFVSIRRKDPLWLGAVLVTSCVVLFFHRLPRSGASLHSNDGFHPRPDGICLGLRAAERLA